jgi:ABC-2 type transport system ATP-binding protein
MALDEETWAIEARELSKSFGTVRALDSVSFRVARGELFGFLGPNGAGKTTTINILTGLARPDSGTIGIGGIDCSRNPKAAQHLMGIVPDESNLYPELTGFENLCFCGSLYGMPKSDRESRARDLIERFGLTEAADRRFAGYSKGMKRKLTIAAGIIHSPEVLFLDEPTSGIDVASARQIRGLVAGLNEGGTTIFLTTHYIEEAERLCRRIAFIVFGRIVEIDSMENLMGRIQGKHAIRFEISGRGPFICEELAAAFPFLTCIAEGERGIRVESKDLVQVGPLARFMEEREIDIFEARKILPSLEDVFVRFTGIEAEDMKRERERSMKGGGQ